VFLVVSFNSTLTEAGQRRIFQTCWQTLLVSDGYPERILPFFELYTKELPASRDARSTYGVCEKRRPVLE
jgi:predicted transcriptional regulator YdeE